MPRRKQKEAYVTNEFDCFICYWNMMLSSCRCILSVGADGVVEAREMKRHLLLAADGGEGASEVPMYRNWGLRMFHCTEYPENSMSILYYCSEDNTKHGQGSASLSVYHIRELQQLLKDSCHKRL